MGDTILKWCGLPFYLEFQKGSKLEQARFQLYWTFFESSNILYVPKLQWVILSVAAYDSYMDAWK